MSSENLPPYSIQPLVITHAVPGVPNPFQPPVLCKAFFPIRLVLYLQSTRRASPIHPCNYRLCLRGCGCHYGTQDSGTADALRIRKVSALAKTQSTNTPATNDSTTNSILSCNATKPDP